MTDVPNPQRDAARKRHHGCPKCGGMFTMHERDGKEVGGMPGITYRECSNCGYCVAKVKKQNRNPFKD